MNGDVPHHTNSITCNAMSPCSEENQELEEERRAIQQQLSSMPSPKVSSSPGCQVKVIYPSSCLACWEWPVPEYQVWFEFVQFSLYSQESSKLVVLVFRILILKFVMLL